MKRRRWGATRRELAPRCLAAVLVAAALVTAGALASRPVPVQAQQAAALPPGLARFVAVHAPVVALTHVRLLDGTGAPTALDQTVVVTGSSPSARATYASVDRSARGRHLDVRGACPEPVARVPVPRPRRPTTRAAAATRPASALLG